MLLWDFYAEISDLKPHCKQTKQMLSDQKMFMLRVQYTHCICVDIYVCVLST
jgi:hypothetical protein